MPPGRGDYTTQAACIHIWIIPDEYEVPMKVRYVENDT